MPRVKFLFLLMGLFVLAAAAVTAAAPMAQGNPPSSGGPAVDGGVPEGSGESVRSPSACSTPTTQNIRGKNVIFDQCYQRNFSHGGTNYSIETYYRETTNATNTAQCTAAENTAGRCEHELSNNDDSNGDNVNAVAMAAEAETAMRFYHDRGLDFLPGSSTTLQIYIAEDPRLGGTPTTGSIQIDDENIDNNDVLNKRLLAFHEIQHLVQYNYDTATGWQDFFGEGIARTIEDRVDTTLDADTGHLFIPEVNGILGSDANRTSDLSTINYRSVLWWTWLMDQYRTGAEVAPVQGWDALLDFYTELNTDASQVNAVRDFISAQGSSFREDFIDYTLALYAYRFSPADPRLTYLDNEIRNNTSGLSGHSVITTGPSFSTVTTSMNPRSSRYWEFNPASQCDYTTFSFDGNGTNFGFSVMTVDGGVLQNRWTSWSNNWARTVRTADLDRAVGIVSAVDQSGTVDVGRGCVDPTLIIKSPTSAAAEMVGNANNPRKMIVRLRVQGADGSSVAGLLASDFTVQLRLAGGGPLLPATIINSAYVQDDYWLLVRPPKNTDGAQNGQFYDLIVSLGPQSDTENSAVLYVKRTQDVMIVLDRSGSMTTANKIQAARNAANLFVNELAGDDQAGYVAFDTDADLREPLAQLNVGGHRQDIEDAIAAEVPLNLTSIGDGMRTAADEHDAHGIPANLCSFILLSDGYQNEPESWADVQAGVVDNGCAIHSIALGPQANEILMQQIAASVPGGSYDYADSSGTVPIAPPALSPGAVTADFLSWQNNLSRVYDNKATQVAGRQRMPWEIVRDNEQQEYYEFFVDETSTELVISVAWQKPTDNFNYELFDPDGNPVIPDEDSDSKYFTNSVLRVFGPKPGYWKLFVYGLDQEFFVSTTAESQVELYLFVGKPVDEMNQGTKVPLVATFVGPDKPVLGADVRAMVRAPNGLLNEVILYDDGVHGDGEPDDGVYGNTYQVTSFGDQPAPDNPPVEGEAPEQVGSYLVTVIGVSGDIRREAQGSFALTACGDENGNRLPDCWEKENEVDDPDGDPDMDNLSNYCEFKQGTDPHDPDTDDGGERDGSEVKGCEIDPNGQDPHDPTDDRVRGLGSVHVRPELVLQKPVIHIWWGPLLQGRLLWVDIYRRMVDGNGNPTGPWLLIKQKDQDNEHVDQDVTPGQSYEYLLIPTGEGTGGEQGQGVSEPTGPAKASNDPYAPGGSVLINGGDETTDSLKVTLTLSADDSGDESDGGPSDNPPGTPLNELEMRLSNTPDFSGVGWRPFQATVNNWDLGDVEPGETATVYVQFRDKAGNVSQSGMGQMDTILYDAPTEWLLYMSVVAKP
ncbi:MAG: VWA domain-containing protein [Anaerolineales bacterium]|nr:VWA domain-containing protein [Anaerolineales bacterium]MCB8934008.1 VWA domain-containing protein [Promineifilum sp.]